MYGWKGRIGLLVPSVNTTAEPEFNKIAPEGVSIYTSLWKYARESGEDCSKSTGFD